MLTTDRFSWHKDTHTLTAEISTLQLPAAPRTLQVQSKKTGKIATFVNIGVDRQGYGSDAEVAGWRYVATNLEQPVNLLIIND